MKKDDIRMVRVEDAREGYEYFIALCQDVRRIDFKQEGKEKTYYYTDKDMRLIYTTRVKIDTYETAIVYVDCKGIAIKELHFVRRIGNNIR